MHVKHAARSLCVVCKQMGETTPSQINDLIGQTRKNNRVARAARFLVQFPTQSANRQREIFMFEVLTTTRARSSKSFILCIYMKTIRAKQAKVHFAYFVQRDQLYFNVTFSLQQTSQLIKNSRKPQTTFIMSIKFNILSFQC